MPTQQTASVADLRQVDRALRATQLLGAGSWLILLALLLSAQRTTETVVVLVLSVILAIGGYAGIEKVRLDALRKGADPITGHTPGERLPLDLRTKLGFAAQLLVAAAVFLVFH